MALVPKNVNSSKSLPTLGIHDGNDLLVSNNPFVKRLNKSFQPAANSTSNAWAQNLPACNPQCSTASWLSCSTTTSSTPSKKSHLLKSHSDVAIQEKRAATASRLEHARGEARARRRPSKKRGPKDFTVTAQSTAERAVKPARLDFLKEKVNPDEDLSPSAREWFGPRFFKDDWFEQCGLARRADFQKLCPRYCQTDDEFLRVADDIPEDSLVERCFKQSYYGVLLDRHEVKQLAERAKMHVVPPGRAVFLEGDPVEAFYVLVKGQISMVASSNSKGALEIARLGEAEIFGEQELAEARASGGEQVPLRQHSALCIVPCRIAAIDAAAYREFFHGVHVDQTLKLQEWLSDSKRCPELSKISKRRRMSVAKLVLPKSLVVTAGGIIYCEGDAAEQLFLVRRGCARASKDFHFQSTHRWPKSHDGWVYDRTPVPTSIVLAEYKEGAIFGEEVLIPGQPRCFQVEAVDGGCELVAISPWIIEQFFPRQLITTLRDRWKNVVQVELKGRHESQLLKMHFDSVKNDLRLAALGPKFLKRNQTDRSGCGAGIDSPSTPHPEFFEVERTRARTREREYHKIIGMGSTGGHLPVDIARRNYEEQWKIKQAEERKHRMTSISHVPQRPTQTSSDLSEFLVGSAEEC